MGRLLLILWALVFSIGAASEQRRQPNRPPTITSFTSSLNTIRVCGWNPNVSLDDPLEVMLVVTANDPDGDPLRYEYSATEGKISGRGKAVRWDLRGLPHGPHEVRVIVKDTKGHQVESVLTVTTVSGGCPDPPPCPTISVACPAETDSSKPFQFYASVAGYVGRPTTLSWKVDAGKIISGQKTSAIEVSAKSAKGVEQITARVVVRGLIRNCPNTAACSTKIIW